MKKHIRVELTDQMLEQIEQIKIKDGKITTNQFISKTLTEYVLASKSSKKLNENRYQILQLITDEMTPLKNRFIGLIDRIEEDYVFIREGINEDE